MQLNFCSPYVKKDHHHYYLTHKSKMTAILQIKPTIAINLINNNIKLSVSILFAHEKQTKP